MSEHTEQKALVSWFKLQYPYYKDCIIAIPNGSQLSGNIGQRSAQVNKLKSEGMKSGASDLFIAVPVRGKHGLWLEMKDKGVTYYKVSKLQREHLALMINMGYAAEWAAGFDKAKVVIEDYMKADLRLCSTCLKEYEQERCEHCY